MTAPTERRLANVLNGQYTPIDDDTAANWRDRKSVV